MRADPDHVDHPISVMYASGASHHYKNFGKLSKVRDVAVNLRHSSNEEHMLRQVGAFSCPSPVFCPVPSYITFIMHCACLFGLRAVTVGFGAPAASRSEPVFPLHHSCAVQRRQRTAAALHELRFILEARQAVFRPARPCDVQQTTSNIHVTCDRRHE